MGILTLGSSALFRLFSPWDVSVKTKPGDVKVHLLPSLAPPGVLSGGVTVVIDVLRATTTIIHALAAGAASVRIYAEVEEARKASQALKSAKVLLAGERGGKPIPGFDMGNSPGEFTQKSCRGATIILTTTNGTQALVRAEEAQRTLAAAFVNYSAVCEQLRLERRPVHILCAGTDGNITLEDTILAGAFVDFLCENGEVELNDAARLAWDCFENHGRILQGALEISQGGANLLELGYEADIRAAAQVDQFNIVPELKSNPLRLEIGSLGFVSSHWKK